MSNVWVSTKVMTEEKLLLPPLLCLPSLYRHSPWGVGFALYKTSQNVHIPFIWCIQSGAYAHLCLVQHPCCRYMATLWQDNAGISWEARLLLPPTRLDFRADNVATSRLVKPSQEEKIDQLSYSKDEWTTLWSGQLKSARSSLRSHHSWYVLTWGQHPRCPHGCQTSYLYGLWRAESLDTIENVCYFYLHGSSACR